ncbi:endolytic transglycosylase MltG [Bacteroidia bacterium]|nr:endolytic transglycosylase MltG [Bacteroidia bacterium]
MLKKYFRILFAVGFGISAWIYIQLKTSVIEKDAAFRIRGDWTLDSLANHLEIEAQLDDKENFKSWAKRLGYSYINPCFVEVKEGKDLWDLIKYFKANRYQTRNVVINPEYNLKQLAKSVSSKIEVSEDEFATAMQSDLILSSFGIDRYNWQALFIPNSYEFFVKSDLSIFLEKMKAAHDKFWNEERLFKAQAQGLTKLEAVSVASIATKESHKTDEFEKIVGVYINRLRIGMPLGADPTINFAKGKGGRVLESDLGVDSRYNTYENVGLPPGPICIPHPKAIEAVLNYTKHNYLYFCAKDDFSGYHNFAESYREHLRNASKWHKALNKLNREKR